MCVSVYEVTNEDAEAILKATQQVTESDGAVRLRGLPFSCSEKDIFQFFSGEILKNVTFECHCTDKSHMLHLSVLIFSKQGWRLWKMELQ